MLNIQIFGAQNITDINIQMFGHKIVVDSRSAISNLTKAGN